MPAKAFVDSNVFLYAAVQDAAELRCSAALNFIQSATDALITSVQVLNEYHAGSGRHAGLRQL